MSLHPTMLHIPLPLLSSHRIHFRYTWSVRLFYPGKGGRGREGAKERRAAPAPAPAPDYVAILGLFVEAAGGPGRRAASQVTYREEEIPTFVHGFIGWE